MPRRAKTGGAVASPGKRYPLNTRTTKETRDRLEQAAAQSGRSLVQELEARLERSFQREDLLPELLELAYGRTLASILMMLGKAMRDAGTASEIAMPPAARGVPDWVNDEWAYGQAVEGAIAILQKLQPKSEENDHPHRPGQYLGWKQPQAEENFHGSKAGGKTQRRRPGVGNELQKHAPPSSSSRFVVDVRIGLRAASGVLDAVSNPDRAGSHDDWAKTVRAMLGPVAARIDSHSFQANLPSAPLEEP